MNLILQEFVPFVLINEFLLQIINFQVSLFKKSLSGLFIVDIAFKVVKFFPIEVSLTFHFFDFDFELFIELFDELGIFYDLIFLIHN